MSKKWGLRFRRWMTDKMDLRQDVLTDLPRITMIGHIHIYIEIHKGWLAFTDNGVRFLYSVRNHYQQAGCDTYPGWIL